MQNLKNLIDCLSNNGHLSKLPALLNGDLPKSGNISDLLYKKTSSTTTEPLGTLCVCTHCGTLFAELFPTPGEPGYINNEPESINTSRGTPIHPKLPYRPYR